MRVMHQALHAVLDALAVANDALDAAPHDLPPPAGHRTPARLRRDGQVVDTASRCPTP